MCITIETKESMRSTIEDKSLGLNTHDCSNSQRHPLLEI